jgi:hypothetical protein
MAATPPTMRTWSEPSLVRAVDLNSQIRDGLGFARESPAALVYRAAVTGLASSTTAVPYPWDTAAFDNTGGGMWSAANASRLTFTYPGKWFVFAKIQFGPYATGLRFGSLRLNAAGNPAAGTQLDADTVTPVPVANVSVRLFLETYVDAGDYVEAFLWQNSTVGQNTVAGLVGGYLAAQWIGQPTGT